MGGIKNQGAKTISMEHPVVAMGNFQQNRSLGPEYRLAPNYKSAIALEVPIKERSPENDAAPSNQNTLTGPEGGGSPTVQ